MIAHDPDTSNKDALNFFINSSAVSGITSNGNQLEDNREVQSWFKVRPSNGDVIVDKVIDRSVAAIVSLSVVVNDTSAPDIQQSTGYFETLTSLNTLIIYYEWMYVQS